MITFNKVWNAVSGGIAHRLGISVLLMLFWGATAVAGTPDNQPENSCSITDISSGGFSFRDGNDTNTPDDDFAQGSVTVYFSQIPASGTLTVTCADFVDGPVTVNVSALSGAWHEIYPIKLRCTGAAVSMTATFSDEPSCPYTEAAVLTAPLQCSQYVFTGDGSWGTASNWLDNNLPGNNSTSDYRRITIASGKTAIIDNYMFSNEDSVFVETGATLRVTYSYAGMSSSATNSALTNYGTLSIEGSAQFTLTNMNLVNHGTVISNGNTQYSLQMSGMQSNIYNYGTINNQKGLSSFSSIYNYPTGVITSTAYLYLSSGIFTNEGTFSHDYSEPYLSCYMGVNNSGTFTILSNGAWDHTPYNSNNSYFINSGTLNNYGTMLFNYTPTFTNTATGVINNNGMMTFRKGVTQDGLFANNATGEVVLTSYSPTFTNNGNFICDGNLVHDMGVNIINNNYMIVNDTMTCSSYMGTFTNNDSLIFSATSKVSMYQFGYNFINGPAGTLLLNGEITAANNYAGFFQNEGFLSGSGSIKNASGFMFTNTATGVITPIGEMTIEKFKNLGTLNVNLGGTTPVTQYDRINAPAEVQFGGTIHAALVNGFQPSCDDYFLVVDGSFNSDSFDIVDVPYGISDQYWADGAALVYGYMHISLENVGDCNGNNTACTSDDVFTSDVTVIFPNYKPSTGTFTITGPTIVGNVPPVNVSSIPGFSYTFTNVTFQATGNDIDLTATFSDGCFYNDDEVSGPAACSPTTDITDISMDGISSCNGNGTANENDDFFTANFTVDFAYAPATGNLVLKNGTTILATKPASELSCVSTWTFSNVQLPANGASIALTAEFNNATFTSGIIGTAPSSCSCTVPVIYCPSNVVVSNAPNACTGFVTWTPPTINGNCNPVLSSSHVNGSQFSNGVNVVTLTVTNDISLTATCTFSVTVNVTSCPAMSAPNVSSITANTALASWLPLACANSYRIMFHKASSSTWSTVTLPQPTATNTFSNLTAATQYGLRIRSVCNGIAGNLSSERKFTTLAAATQSGAALTAEETNEAAKVNIEYSLKAYPNPTNGQFYIELDGVQSDRADISLLDASGRNILHWNTQINHGAARESVDIHDYPAGLYTVRVTFADGTTAVRAVIKY